MYVRTVKRVETDDAKSCEGEKNDEVYDEGCEVEVRAYLVVIAANFFDVGIFTFDQAFDCPEKYLLLAVVVYGLD